MRLTTRCLLYLMKKKKNQVIKRSIVIGHSLKDLKLLRQENLLYY